MSMGNEIGFAYSEDVDLEKIFGYAYGAFVVEVSSEAIDNIIGADIIDLGKTTAEKAIVRGDERIDLAGIEKIYEDKLEPIYSCNIETADNKLETFRYETSERLHAKVRVEKPKVLIPVFPVTTANTIPPKLSETPGRSRKSSSSTTCRQKPWQNL